MNGHRSTTRAGLCIADSFAPDTKRIVSNHSQRDTTEDESRGVGRWGIRESNEALSVQITLHCGAKIPNLKEKAKLGV